MGPYLGQPITDKIRYKAESSKLGLRFSRCEMQGSEGSMQDGEEPWRTQPFLNWTSGAETPSLPFSTATEVTIPRLRSIGGKICREALPGQIESV